MIMIINYILYPLRVLVLSRNKCYQGVSAVVMVWILYLFNLAMFLLRVIVTCSVKSCFVSEPLFMAMCLSFNM